MEKRLSQTTNNNAYCQDNETSWCDWSLTEKNRSLLCFWTLLIVARTAAARQPMRAL
jgi:glycogen operon protein